MIATSFYSICLCCLLTFMIIRHKKFNIIGTMLIGLFAIESIFSVALLMMEKFNVKYSVNYITLYPYLLLILVLIIYISPFFKKQGFEIKKYNKELGSNYRFFAYFYLFCAVITIGVGLPASLKMIGLGNWSQFYGKASVNPYTNIITYFATNFCDYTRILAFIAGFSMIRVQNSRAKNMFPIILIVFAILTGINHAVLSTSRSMIYDVTFIIIFIYVFFYKNVEKNKKLFFNILGICALVGVSSLFMNITVSRFESRGTWDYLVTYLGEAPIVFNSQIVGSVTKLSWGNFAWGSLIDSQNFNQVAVGGTWGTRFYTFAGWVYLDWGALGLILIGTLISLYISYKINRKNYEVSDLYLIFSYLLFLIKGLFVIGRDFYINIIATILIYLFLKYFLEKYIFKIGKVKLKN